MERTGNHGGGSSGAFIRLGGVATLVAFAIHVVANGFLKRFPPEDPTLDELKAYLYEEAATWAVVHGLRYVAFVGLALLAAALFMRTGGVRDARATGWGLVGLLGAALHVTNGVITNGIETFAFTDFGWLSEDPELFHLVFQMTRVLFTAEIVAWGLVIAGFSLAGWVTSTLPRWLSILGFVSGPSCIACGVFLVSILTGGWAVVLVEITSLGGLVWFLSAGVLLAFRGEGDGKRVTV